jgi:hypothetical protein
VIGTTAALITMAAVSAGTKATGAFLENRAAGKASKAMQQAATDSNRVARSVYQDQTAMTQPYRQAGAQSVGLLGSLMMPQGQPGSYSPQNPMMQTPLQQSAGQMGGPPRGVPRGLGGAMMGGGPPMGGPPMGQQGPMGPRPYGGPMPGTPYMPGVPGQYPVNPWQQVVGRPNAFMPRY